MTKRDDRRWHAEWTEDELDDALARLRPSGPTPENVLVTARERVLVTVASSQDGASNQPVRQATPAGWWRASRRRMVSAAAAVLVVVGIVTGVVVFQSATAGPASAEAVAVLNRAATAIGSSDPPIAAGQYRYVVSRAWHLREIGSERSGPMSYLAETMIEVWAPTEYRQEWQQERTTTGRKIWLQGDEQQARAAKLLVDYPEPRSAGGPVQRAACGDFYAVGTDRAPCTAPGSWQNPTPEFVAGLPRDPQQLHDRLLRDAPGSRRGDMRALVLAADALRTGLLPADVRSALYQALTRLRGLELVDGAANLDGRLGTALGIDDGSVRRELIIDPATGLFVGERQVLTSESDSGLHSGTVTSFTSVAVAVVDAVGARPSR